MLSFIPWIVNLELTNACNLSCVFCNHRELKKTMRIGDMNTTLLEKILKEIAGGFPGGKLYELGLVGLGEPTLARHLLEDLQIISRYADRIERISLNSNLVKLTLHLADRLLDSPINAYTFSLNASNPKTYRRLMGKDRFSHVVEHLRIFLKRRFQKGSCPSVAVQVIDSEDNDLNQLVSCFADEMLSDVKFFERKIYTKPLFRKEFSGVNLHAIDESDRYPCFDIHSRIYVDVNGFAYPCTIGNDCYREKSNLCLGNVHESSLLDLFNGPVNQAAWERQLGGQLAFPECAVCNIWNFTPNNFTWDTAARRWHVKEKQIRAYGLKNG